MLVAGQRLSCAFCFLSFSAASTVSIFQLTQLSILLQHVIDAKKRDSANAAQRPDFDCRAALRAETALMSARASETLAIMAREGVVFCIFCKLLIVTDRARRAGGSLGTLWNDLNRAAGEEGWTFQRAHRKISLRSQYICVRLEKPPVSCLYASRFVGQLLVRGTTWKANGLRINVFSFTRRYTACLQNVSQ